MMVTQKEMKLFYSLMEKQITTRSFGTVKSSHVIVHTLALGPYADKVLQAMADETGKSKSIVFKHVPFTNIS